MKRLKIISYIFLLLSSFTIYSQSEIEQLFFKHNISIAPGSNDNISLGITRGVSISSKQVNTDSKEFYTVSVIQGKKKFRRRISVEKFDEICQKIVEINPKDIIKNAGLYLDGATTDITFSVFSNSVTYSVHGLNKADEETSRKTFLEVTKLFLEVIDYKIRYIN